MSKLSVFNYMSLDGFFAGPQGEIDWFASFPRDPELDALTGRESKTGGQMMFGRTTYEMMKSYWPTPEALKNDPDTAGLMNAGHKVVFSKTLRGSEETGLWRNVTVLHEIVPAEIVRLKANEATGIVILGSGTVVQQLTRLGLIDEYTLLLVPIVLGAGKSFFKDVDRTNLTLLEARGFGNGIVRLRYEPAHTAR